jgi:tRNA1Val (adenine37-N6)-methyltransferase
MRATAKTPRDGETLDTFFHGRIRVLQPKRGYRFSVDAPLLADFIRTRRTDDILEVGTGSGIISLLLGRRPFRQITAIEIQPGLAALARRNVTLNGLRERIKVVHADFRTYRPGRKFDLVFANPPYIKGATGYLSASAEKSAAKHELYGGIGEMLARTAGLLAPGGRAAFVYPEKRRPDFLKAAGESGLAVRRLRFVHPRAGVPANLFLVEIGHAGEKGEPEPMPPLVLFGPDGTHTAEAEAVFAG